MTVSDEDVQECLARLKNRLVIQCFEFDKQALKESIASFHQAYDKIKNPNGDELSSPYSIISEEIMALHRLIEDKIMIRFPLIPEIEIATMIVHDVNEIVTFSCHKFKKP
jgi:hypothetical protein